MSDNDPISETRRFAVIAKVLRDRHPGRSLREYAVDARAILAALEPVRARPDEGALSDSGNATP